MISTGSRGRCYLWCLSAIVVATSAVRLGFAIRFFGFWTGDDVEILQRGFAIATGLPYQPWEIRHLLLPDLIVAPAVRLASVSGVSHVDGLVLAAKLPFVALAGINILLVFQLARRWLPTQWPALLAATLYAFHWLPLAYGSTVYPRTATTTCVLTAALILCSCRRGWTGAALAGGAVALAFAFRFSEVIFFVPCCALLLLDGRDMSQRLRECLAFLAGLIVVAGFVVGVEDWITWGQPFASFISFARYTLVEGASSSLVSEQPWFFYLWRLPKWLPPTLLVFFFGRVEWSRLTRPLLFVVLPVLSLSVIHHKELRYLQCVIPFVAIAAAGACWAWWQRGQRAVVAILVGLSLIWGLSGVTFMSKTSMAAVMAARSLSKDEGLRRVALSQAWAYGANLWLAAADVRDLPVHPTRDDLDAAAVDCQAIALYLDVFSPSAGLKAWLSEHGFHQAASFSHLNSRPVVILRRRPEKELRQTRRKVARSSNPAGPEHGITTSLEYQAPGHHKRRENRTVSGNGPLPLGTGGDAELGVVRRLMWVSNWGG